VTRELFGTDGVRGIAGQYPLDEAGAIKIGMAIGSHFGAQGKTIVIGCDPRASSEQLVEQVSSGLMQAGANVERVGVLPTPGLAYLTREGDYAAGVMITASHNPVEYNGVKVFDSNGGKLSDETEARLNDLIVNGVEMWGEGRSSENKELVKWRSQRFSRAGL
jgi:phosphoglucosamine mutase